MLLVVTAASVAAMAQSARATVTTLATFSNPGPYVWTVPTGVTSVTFDVFGASGGNVVAVHNGVLTVVASGGVGGEAKGRFPVHAGERFEILVGGQGGEALGLSGRPPRRLLADSTAVAGWPWGMWLVPVAALRTCASVEMATGASA